MEINIGKSLARVFGSRNDRLLKRYRRVVLGVNAVEPKVQAMSDLQLRQRTDEIRQLIREKKLTIEQVMDEGFAIIREAMDRHIGIRNIFNPEESFDPDKLSDAMLELYDGVQRHMIATGEPWNTVAIPPELYGAVREIYPESRPPFRTRPFDVQIIGGMVLYEGKIAEMATGEGKTFVAPLACFLKVLQGYHCHVVTVNDYLVQRDAKWVRPAFAALGIEVGYIQSDMDPGGEGRKKAYECEITYGTNAEFGFDYLRDNMKERADLQVQGKLDFAIVDEVDSILIDEARTPLIISGPAHDDAEKYRRADAVARRIVELNKPWDANAKIIEAAKRAIKAAEGDMDKYKGKADMVAAALKRKEEAQRQLDEAEGKKAGLTQYYEVELDRKSAHLTHEGISAAQEVAGVGSFYVGDNMEWPHLMDQSMRAHVVYERDRDYVVERGQRGELEVVIVDEYTGRKMVGRQWSEGLHQAIEAKERVPIKQETQTLATITLQNFFRLYKFLAGMTGTAQTEAEEFAKIYKLEVVTIPTNRPTIRRDNEDRVYRTEREKWEAIIDEIKEVSDHGRPVLVGTTSVEKSEMLSNMLTRKYGIVHEVLNAKQHEREAMIVVKAGQQNESAFGQLVGNVTIATNMAGRGTDIKLAPETLFDVEHKGEGKYTLTQRGTGKTLEVDSTKEDEPAVHVFQLTPATRVVGGLHVIGTERHTARRIDNQLRGRSGRQGDPGSSRFYVSLQDDLMRMFAGDWTLRVLGWLGMEEGMAIEDKRISKGILRAQKKVEERNYLARKHLLEYDEVMDHQRNSFYGMRQRVLESRGIDQVVWDMISDAISDSVDKYITQDYVANVISEWARSEFEVSIEPEDLRGLRTQADVEDLIRGKARVEAQLNISSTLGEFMGETPDNPEEWDTRGLSNWAQQRFQVDLPQSQIRKTSPAQLEEQLQEAALEQIEKRDVGGLAKFLEPLYAESQLCAWAEAKFGMEVKPQELLIDEGRNLRKPAAAIEALLFKHARSVYRNREVEYPVTYMLSYVAQGQEISRIDNPYAAQFVQSWARARYGLDLAPEKIMETPVDDLRQQFIRRQAETLEKETYTAVVDELIAANSDHEALATAFNARFASNVKTSELEDASAPPAAAADGAAPREDVHSLLLHRARSFYRQELTDLEQYILISILDQSWKDHLYAMDMLKSGIGLHAYAERDPRVLYKKEGYRYFQEMMVGVRDKVTDLIFRAYVQGRAQAKSAYTVTAATHQESAGYGVSENLAAAPEAGEMQQASEQSQGEGAKAKPIINEAPRVGRNDPCPCGSGKKYKKCCGAEDVNS
jgi:preprotein translocase subunit SecA